MGMHNELEQFMTMEIRIRVDAFMTAPDDEDEKIMTMKPAEIIAEMNEGRDPGDPLLTYRQLDFWYRSGYITKEPVSPGSGRERLLNEDEVKIIRLMAPLVHFGLSLEAASFIARAVVHVDPHSILASFPIGPNFTLSYHEKHEN